MNFDFNIYNIDYNEKYYLIKKESTGVVKSLKVFPVFKIDNKEFLFKALSKTKPLTTPLFAYSEVFWSTIINNYFDSKAPIYKLAICKDYEKEYPNRYSKGTIVENVLKKEEKIIDLVDYYNTYEDSKVNIKDYINYCGMYYDYTDIFESTLFKNNINLGKELANQVLISLLKMDINFHYENIGFIYKEDKLVSLVPPLDHEFSIPFLFNNKTDDDSLQKIIYMANYKKVLCDNIYLKDSYNSFAIIKNLNYIFDNYIDVVLNFSNNLESLINDLKDYRLIIPDNGYMEPFSTDLYKVYETIHKSDNCNTLSDINKYKLEDYDLNLLAKYIQEDIMISINILNKSLLNKLENNKIKLKN